jgi:hypothetical protein
MHKRVHYGSISASGTHRQTLLSKIFYLDARKSVERDVQAVHDDVEVARHAQLVVESGTDVMNFFKFSPKNIGGFLLKLRLVVLRQLSKTDHLSCT